MSTKKRKPVVLQRRRTRGGIEERTCTRCGHWLPIAMFTSESATRRKSQCKDCVNKQKAVWRDANRDKLRASQKRTVMRRQRDLKKADREFARWKEQWGSLRFPVSVIEPWARELVALYGSNMAAAEYIGVSEKHVRMMLGESPPPKSVSFDIAERYAIGARAVHRLHTLLPKAGREGWGPNGQIACARCGSFFHEYGGRGYCRRCLPHVIRMEKAGLAVVPPARAQWTRWWACCRLCGRTNIRHQGRGLCSTCWKRVLREGGMELMRSRYPTEREERRRAFTNAA